MVEGPHQVVMKERSKFSDLPASLVRSLNVIKVPTADMVEGSIETINVKPIVVLN